MNLYRISDLNIEINTHSETLLKNLEGYVAHYEAKPNVTLEVSDDLLLQLMEENEGYTANQIECSYIATLYSWAIFDFNGFPIRASAVEFDGKAVLFAAPFDTSVNLHEMIPDDLVFARDYPGIRLEDETYYIFDTPFGHHATGVHGKKVPLSSIVFVDTEHFDSLRRLEAKDFVPMFMRAVAENIRQERTKHTLFVLERLMHKVSFFGVGDVSDIDFILERV